MDHQTLQLFGRQLARWAEEFIAEGRFPFRRIETSLPLLTALGEISLPLVLWVNRDSFMAGGLFLFPTRTTEEELESGLAFADALGLRHFVTWARREIIIWEAAGGEAHACRRIPLPAVSRPDPDQFR
ncbi:MAG: hypothetical protein IH614_01995, partial [Desulfuromonadales bacterium]|nr:hypothetical protein [Desulfuromonadales bacterium]